MVTKDFDANCLFCKIVAGKIPSEMVYKDKDVVVVKDIKPAAPVHVLVVPVKHIATLAAMTDEDTALGGKMIAAANKVAKDLGLAERGYRLIINSGPEAGQEVQHLHMHLVGGRKLKWEL